MNVYQFVNHIYFKHIKKQNNNITGRFTLKDMLDSVILNDYYIFKATRHFKLISYEELISEKYSGYIIIRKDYINIDEYYIWFKFLKESKMDVYFLLKPLPSTSLIDKIIIH